MKVLPEQILIRARLALVSLVLCIGIVVVPAGAQALSTDVPEVITHLRQVYGVAKPGRVGGLQDLVKLQRLSWPDAVVTSTFHDWRTVSKYRRQAGLHLGYDIAMPLGAEVRAGWEGTVVQIAHWWGPEYGVTVRSPDGTEVTYGHISAQVGVGARVDPGQVIGRIASDHVDVKMRDSLGRYVPFGEGAGAIPAGVVSREGVLVGWLVSRNAVDLAREELWRHQVQGSRWKLEKEQLERQIPKLEKAHTLMKQYARDGLVSLRRVEESRQELAEAKRRLKALEQGRSTPAKTLEQNLKLAEARARSYDLFAQSRGYRWSDVEALVAESIQHDKKLEARVVEFKNQQGLSDAQKLAALTQKVEAGRERLRTLIELHQMGGLSTQDLETARQRQLLLEAELESLEKLLHKR